MHTFDLFLDRDLRMRDGIPFGESGDVVASDHGLVVTFASGCCLEITFDQNTSVPVRLGTCQIVACVDGCSSFQQGFNHLEIGATRSLYQRGATMLVSRLDHTLKLRCNGFGLAQAMRRIMRRLF